jgi:hypothetical protein
MTMNGGARVCQVVWRTLGTSGWSSARGDLARSCPKTTAGRPSRPQEREEAAVSFWVSSIRTTMAAAI